MEALLTLDGKTFLIKGGDDIIFGLPAELSEDIHLSKSNAMLLAYAILAAVKDAD